MVVARPLMLASSIQLLPDTTFFFQLLIFGLVVATLTWGVFGPILKVLDLRKQRTIGDATQAHDIDARCETLVTTITEQLKAARAEAFAIQEASRQDGFAEATRIMEEARKSSLESLATARHTIQQEVEKAKSLLTSEANVFATAIVTKLAPKTIEKKIEAGIEENGVSE